MKIIGRFTAQPLKEFLQSMAAIAMQSRKLTPAEKAALKIEYSLDHDFRAGFEPREHGLDAYSLARREIARLAGIRAEEIRLAEVQQIRAQISAAEKLVQELTKQLAALDSGRVAGSPIYLARQREILQARESAEQRKEWTA